MEMGTVKNQDMLPTELSGNGGFVLVRKFTDWTKTLCFEEPAELDFDDAEMADLYMSAVTSSTLEGL